MRSIDIFTSSYEMKQELQNKLYEKYPALFYEKDLDMTLTAIFMTHRPRTARHHGLTAFCCAEIPNSNDT